MAITRPNTLGTSRCHPPSDPPAEQTHSSGPEVVAAARQFVCEVLARLTPALADSQIDDARLIVSELVTNAVRYGTEPGDSVRVVIAPAADVVRIEVHDTVRRRPRIKPESDERVRGRGLFIVEALAVRWGVDDRPLGKAVWAEVAR
ncbi:ATP-binding protein [Streptomyces mayteni]